MVTTRVPASAARRPVELPPLSRIDRLALAVGLQLMLWSHLHAGRAADAARASAVREQLHRETRDALLRRAGVVRW